MTISALIAAGMPVNQANAITGTKSVAQTSAGSAQSDATTLEADAVLLTTVASSTGVIIPSSMNVHSYKFIANGGANTLAVYPPTGGQINDASANAAYSVAAGKAIMVIRLSSTHFIAIGA